MLRAFRRVAAAIPRARLVLAGQANAHILPRLAGRLGIADRVEFLGYRPDAAMPAVYRQASVFVIPSDQEGLCIAGLEAMACGLPVISTRCGGPEAFVIHGETGLLVSRDNEVELANSLTLLLADEDYRKRLGRQARALVQREYSYDVFACHLRKVYAQVWPNGFPFDTSSCAGRTAFPSPPQARES